MVNSPFFFWRRKNKRFISSGIMRLIYLGLYILFSLLSISCGGGDDTVSITGDNEPLKFDPTLSSNSQYFFVASPPDFSSVNVESFIPPPVDWRRVTASSLLEVASIERTIDYSLYLTASQPNKSKYGGWDVHPVLSMLNTAYLISQNSYYLDKFIELYEYFKSVRMDSQNRVSFDGTIRPQWERQDRLNIFNLSPYYDYSNVDPDALIAERGWQSLFFSDINHSGLYIDQMLRFAQIVKEYNLLAYMHTADLIIDDAIKVIESHEDQWVKVSDSSGYYIFPKASPFFIDGVEIPINEAAIFGSSVARLYALTNDGQWLNRALEMWNHWQSGFALDEFGYITYPYVMGDWRQGWSADDAVSLNTPSSPAVTDHESFHKAGLTIQFLILLEQLQPGLTARYLSEFQKLIRAAQLMEGTVTAEFPETFGFNWPRDTVHTHPPFYEGWVGLMHQDEMFAYSLHRNRQLDPDHSYPTQILYSELLSGMQHNLARQTKTIVVKPDFMDEPFEECHIYEEKSYVAKVTFRKLTPKHNTLYLHVDKSIETKVRLKIDKATGFFEGKMFVPKDRCVILSWLPVTDYSHPLTDSENEIQIDLTDVYETQ